MTVEYQRDQDQQKSTRSDAGFQHSLQRATEAFAHVELPIPRDRLLHLGVGSTLIFLALAATLAHAVARPAGPPALRTLAWVPVSYSLPAACTAFVLALRRRPGRWAYRIHGAAMALGVAIGGVGALVHAAASGRQDLGLTALFGSPTMAPLTFAGVAAVGWIAAWSDEALGVGRAPQVVARGVAPAVPGRRALLLITLLGFLSIAVIGGVDHAAEGVRWTEAIALILAAWAAGGVLATLLGVGKAIWKLNYVGAMMGNVLVGFLGLALHLSANMEGPPEALLQRMVLQAPLAAPLLHGLLGMLGMLAVAEPAVGAEDLEDAWPPRRRRSMRDTG
jgi:hypothetical protein